MNYWVWIAMSAVSSPWIGSTVPMGCCEPIMPVACCAPMMAPTVYYLPATTASPLVSEAPARVSPEITELATEVANLAEAYARGDVAEPVALQNTGAEQPLENAAAEDLEAIGYQQGVPAMALSQLALDSGVATIGPGTLYPNANMLGSSGGGGGGFIPGSSSGDQTSANPGNTIINNVVVNPPIFPNYPEVPIYPPIKPPVYPDNPPPVVPEPLSVAVWSLVLGAGAWRQRQRRLLD